MSTDSSKASPLSHRRRNVRLCGFLLLLLLVPILFLSQIIQYVLPQYLESQSQGIQLTMSGADVDLLERRIRLIDVHIGPRDGLALQFQHVDGRINFKALLAGEFPLEDLKFQGGELDLEALQRSNLNSSGGSDNQALMIPEISISDFKLKRVSTWLGRDVVIQRLYLKGLETQPQTITSDSLTTQRLRSRIELQLKVGDGGVRLEGEFGLRGENLSSDVRLRVTDLELSGFENLLAQEMQLQISGLVNADSQVNLDYNPNDKTLESHLSGVIDTQQLMYQGPSTSVALNGKYTGELHLDSGLSENQSKIDSQGLVQISDIKIEQAMTADEAWSIEASNLKYQGSLEFSDHLQAQGEVQSVQTHLQLKSSAQDISARDLDFRLDFTDEPQSKTLVILTALKVGELIHNNPELASGRVTGQDMAVQKLTVSQGYSTEFQHISAASLSTQGGAAEPAVDVIDLELKQLNLGHQGDLRISTGSVKGLEIKLPSGPVILKEVALTELKRTPLGVVTAQGFRAGQLDLRLNNQSLQAQGLALTELKRTPLGVVTAQGFRAGQLDLQVNNQSLQAQGLILGTFAQLNDNEFSAATLELQSLNNEIGINVGVKGLSATDVKLDTRNAVNAALLTTHQFDLSLDAGNMVLRNGQVRDLNYTFNGHLNFGQLRSDQFDHQHSKNNVTAIMQPVLENLSLDFESQVFKADQINLSTLSTTQTSPAARVISGPITIQAFVQNEELGTELGSIEAKDFTLGISDPPQVALPHIEVASFKVKAGQGLSVASVVLNAPEFRLVQDSNGDLNMPQLPFSDDEPQADAGPFWIQIQKLKTLEKSSFKFIDQQVKPTYKLEIKPFMLELEGFNNRPGELAGHYKFSGQTNNFTNLDVSGKTQAGNNGMNISVAGKLTGMALKNLSPYTGTYEKFAISQGRGDLTMSGNIRGGELDLKTKLVISKLELEPFYQGTSDNPEAEDSSGSLVMALTLLSDDKKTVKMKVPITGTLEDPIFDFSHATTQAVTGVAKGAVMLAFQPLGMLLSAVKLAGGIDSMAVEPVLFSPGQANLGAESITLLDSLAEKLTELPKLKVSICGRVVKADASALAKTNEKDLNAAQINLAQLRTGVVHDYLELKKLIPAKQLKGVCKDMAEESGDAEPRTEMSLNTSDISAPAKTNTSPTPAN